MISKLRIGTSELLLILVVALLALGPEKMVIYAKKVGKTVKSVKAYTSEFTEDFNENIVKPLEEAQKPLKEAVKPITDMAKDVTEPVENIKSSVSKIGNSVEVMGQEGVKETSKQIDPEVKEIDATY